MSKRAWIIVGILVALLLVCGGCTILGAGGLLWATREPEGIALEVEAPETVGVGQEAVVRIRVINQTDRTRRLDSIDIDTTLLENLSITGTEPPAVDILTQDDFHSYSFGDVTIAPQGTLDIQVRFTGQAPGSAQGSIDVCIDGPARCISTPVLFLRVTP